jgi:hypothetical protein
MQMIQSTVSIFRMNPFLTEHDLIHMVTSRFKKDGLAFAWWHAKVQSAPFGYAPYNNWDTFCEDFQSAMGAPDMGSAVRIDLAALKMEGDDLPGYIADFRQDVIKLENLAQPMSQHDQVFNFLKGLPKKGKWAGLRRAVDTAMPLSSNIERVMKKFHKDKIIHLVSDADGTNLPSHRDDERRPARANVMSREDTAEWNSDGEPEELHALPQEENEDDRHDRGGRGKGRGSGVRGRGGRFNASRGRGRNERPPLSAEQRRRLENGQCIICGDAGHWARDCPTLVESEAN